MDGSERYQDILTPRRNLQARGLFRAGTGRIELDFLVGSVVPAEAAFGVGLHAPLKCLPVARQAAHDGSAGHRLSGRIDDPPSERPCGLQPEIDGRLARLKGDAPDRGGTACGLDHELRLAGFEALSPESALGVRLQVA